MDKPEHDCSASGCVKHSCNDSLQLCYVNGQLTFYDSLPLYFGRWQLCYNIWHSCHDSWQEVWQLPAVLWQLALVLWQVAGSMIASRKYDSWQLCCDSWQLCYDSWLTVLSLVRSSRFSVSSFCIWMLRSWAGPPSWSGANRFFSTPSRNNNNSSLPIFCHVSGKLKREPDKKNA